MNYSPANRPPPHIHTDAYDLTYLDGQFAGRSQDDGLNTARSQHIVLAQVLCDWQAESESLATSREVAGDHVLTMVDRVETVLLDWE